MKDTEIQIYKDCQVGSKIILLFFFGWVGVVPRKAEDALYHMYLISYSLKILSSCPYSTPMIPWHQKKITTQNLTYFWVTEWLAVFKTFPFHFPWFLWLTAPWFPPWRVGFTISQVLWSKSLAHSAALSKVGTWKTDWFSGWKPWKDAKGTQKRKDRLFGFYKVLVSRRMSVGKWVMRREMNVRTAIYYLPVLNCKWTREKHLPCLPTTLLWSNISYPGSRLGEGRWEWIMKLSRAILRCGIAAVRKKMGWGGWGNSTPIYFQWPRGRFSSRRPLIFKNVGWTFT